MASKGRERSGGSDASKSRRLLAIEVNGEPLTIDPRAMTLLERRAMRAELAKLGDVEPDYMDNVAAQVWIAMRRTDPDVTLEHVLDSLVVADIDEMEWVDPEADSPEA